MKFNLEVGSSVIDEDDQTLIAKNVSNGDSGVVWKSKAMGNQVIMFNSLNDFKQDINKQMMRRLQNATVRNMAGFQGVGNGPVE